MTTTTNTLNRTSLTWTPLSLEDVPALTALLNRVDAVEQSGEPAEEPSIREWLSMPELDLAQDSVAVRDGEALLGFCAVDVSTAPDTEGRVRCQLMGTVDPARRRQGLGMELFAWAETRAAQPPSATPTSRSPCSGHPGDGTPRRMGRRTPRSPAARRCARSSRSAATSVPAAG